MEFKPNDIILLPLITEKSTQQRKKDNKYSFLVNRLTNRSEVKKAVEKMFSVKVLKCNIINSKGKLKRVRMNYGFLPNTKKAVVTLDKGAKIDFFEGF